MESNSVGSGSLDYKRNLEKIEINFGISPISNSITHNNSLIEDLVGDIDFLKRHKFSDALAGQDRIVMLPGAVLPPGLSLDDIKDAILQAKIYEDFYTPLRVRLQKEVIISDGVMCSGFYSWITGEIFVSTDAALIAERLPCRLDSFTHSPAADQLWATVFEEALHAVRRMNGKDGGYYYRLPANFTEDEFQRYLNQEIEAVVDEALNSGILQKRVGVLARRYRKKVIVPKVSIDTPRRELIEYFFGESLRSKLTQI